MSGESADHRRDMHVCPRTSNLFLLISLPLNTAAAIALIHTGAADALWHHITPDLPWRTGPSWSATLLYIAVIFLLHAVLNFPFERLARKKGDAREKGDAPLFPDLTIHSIRFVAGSCFVVAAQVLMPRAWPVMIGVVLAALIVVWRAGERRDRGITQWLFIWTWLVLGFVCSRWLIPQWTLGSPQHLPRLALMMTLWLAPIRVLWCDPAVRRMLMWMPNFACRF